MKLTEIQTMFDYNDWANHRLLTMSSKVTPEQFKASGSFPYGGLQGTLVHILDAEYAWRMRLESDVQTQDLPVSDFPTVDVLEKRWKTEELALLKLLGGLTDEALNNVVRYTVDGGQKRERILWHCLYHLVNHGTQHRSEAAALLTDLGQSPGDLDFTVYLNTKV